MLWLVLLLLALAGCAAADFVTITLSDGSLMGCSDGNSAQPTQLFTSGVATPQACIDIYCSSHTVGCYVFLSTTSAKICEQITTTQFANQIDCVNGASPSKFYFIAAGVIEIHNPLSELH